MKLLTTILLSAFLAAKSYAAIAPMDVVFLFDSSGSIDPADYETQKSGIQTIINNLPVNSSEVNVSLSQFATSNQSLISLTGNTTNLSTSLTNASQLYGQTSHTDAFSAAAAELTNNGRIGATSIVLLITDGEADSFVGALPASNDLKNSGYLLYSIGIGGDIDTGDLELYASSPSADFTFTYADFDAFAAAASSISTDILTHSTNVPEPSSTALLLIPLTAIGFTATRRRIRNVRQ